MGLLHLACLSIQTQMPSRPVIKRDHFQAGWNKSQPSREKDRPPLQWGENFRLNRNDIPASRPVACYPHLLSSFQIPHLESDRRYLLLPKQTAKLLKLNGSFS